MTQAIFRAYRSAAVGLTTINGVQAVDINLVDSSSDAVVIAAAVAKLNAAMADAGEYPANYFDTVYKVVIGTAPFASDGNAVVFADNAAPLALA